MFGFRLPVNRKRLRFSIRNQNHVMQKIPIPWDFLLDSFINKEKSLENQGFFQFVVRMGGFEPPSFRRRILSPLCMPFHHICALYFGFWCMSNYSIEPCPSQAKLFCGWRGNRDAEHASRYTRYGLFSMAGETNRNGGEMKEIHRLQPSLSSLRS